MIRKMTFLVFVALVLGLASASYADIVSDAQAFWLFDLGPGDLSGHGNDAEPRDGANISGGRFNMSCERQRLNLRGSARDALTSAGHWTVFLKDFRSNECGDFSSLIDIGRDGERNSINLFWRGGMGTDIWYEAYEGCGAGEIVDGGARDLFITYDGRWRIYKGCDRIGEGGLGYGNYGGEAAIGHIPMGDRDDDVPYRTLRDASFSGGGVWNKVLNCDEMQAAMAAAACTDVPDVVGMQQAAAEAAIAGVGLVPSSSGVYSDAVPEGEVMSQDPAGGECVDPGSTVNLVVSLGLPEVPDVSGMTPEEACAAIAAVDELACGEAVDGCWEVGEEPVPVGIVMGSEPAAGTPVPIGSSVNIVVSTGQCVHPVAVDIKPGSCPTPFNLASQGVTPVAILGSEDFDVSMIDPASIRVAGVAALRSAMEDVGTPLVDGEECECHAAGADGIMDMTAKISTQMIVMQIADLVAPDAEIAIEVQAYLQDGTLVGGEDCIILVGQVPSVIDAMRGDINGDGKVTGADLMLLRKAWYMEWELPFIVP